MDFVVCFPVADSLTKAENNMITAMQDAGNLRCMCIAPTVQTFVPAVKHPMVRNVPARAPDVISTEITVTADNSVER